jgi:hypothetical protein
VGTVSFLTGIAVVVASGAMIGASLRLRTAAAYLLAVYVIAWTEIVVLSVLLSIPHALTRASLLAGLAVVSLAAFVVWRQLGRPPPPLARARGRWLLHQLRDPVLGLLAVVVVAGYLYAAALAFLTPQNDGDPLVYELTRAALWRQEHGIGIIDADFELRLDGNPIVAEVGQLATMVLSGSDRYVALGQLTAVVALALGAYALGRRIGLDPRGALFGALIVPTLPVVVLQSWTAGNDVVAGSFVVAAAVFVLGRAPPELALAALATGLAVATKFTGPLMLPVLVLLAVVGVPSGRRLRAVAAIGAGVVLGSGWYVANLVRTGTIDGGLEDFSGQGATFGLGNAASTASRLLVDAIEASGAIEWYAWAYVVAAAAFAAALLGARARPTAFLGPLVVACVPLAAWLTVRLLSDGLAWAWDLVREPGTAAELRDWDWELQTVANAYMSWYGPIGVFTTVAMIVVSVVAARRGSLSRAAVALAVTPAVAFVVIAASLDYDLSRGRFLMGALVVGCATWGLMMRVRWLAGAVALTSAVTLGLVLVNAMAKPSGLQAGQYASSPAIWRLERWQAQMLLRPVPTDQGESGVVELFERSVPEDETVALALRSNDFLFPYFGQRLRRTVELLDEDEVVSVDAEWLVAAPERRPLACPESWRLVHAPTEWRVWQRAQPDRCESPSPI